jgi:hypothetical protein
VAEGARDELGGFRRPPRHAALGQNPWHSSSKSDAHSELQQIAIHARLAFRRLTALKECFFAFLGLSLGYEVGLGNDAGHVITLLAVCLGVFNKVVQFFDAT